MKFINFLLLTVFFSLYSCKEEEVKINPCANGQLDAGEEEIDCGGTCKACYKYAYMFVSYKDSLYSITNKSLINTGSNWILSGSFDTIQFNLNLGTTIDVGTSNINASNTSCMGGQLPYTFISGIMGISENNTLSRELSGNFEAYFKRGIDTIKLKAGQFEYLKY
ncbi:MAG: hypothetical protein ACK5B9_10785 [Flavobacteriia bacterium]|jgi:hypothetical protein